jgi:transporter family protein
MSLPPSLTLFTWLQSSAGGNDISSASVIAANLETNLASIDGYLNIKVSAQPAATEAASTAFTEPQRLRRVTIAAMNWIGWALLSAVFAAATALLAKVGVAHVDSNLAMALRTSVVVVFAWAIALALGKHGEIVSLDRRTLLFLALSGLATGLSWICYFRALQLGPASRVAPLDKLSVPLVMVLAWLLLGEKLTTSAVLGGLLITAGAVVIALG